jgi:hypothetical protein
MDILLLLLASYALCFAFQHKLTFVHKRSAFIDKLLQCTFCTGFHTGWFIRILYHLGEGPLVLSIANLIHLFIFALVSSSVCYLLDCIATYLEQMPHR